MSSVTLTGVTKAFSNDVKAVDAVSLEVQEGEFLVLLGPSGCGKTTLLRMIAGLEQPTAGEIRIADKLVNFDPPKDRDIAMVFQNYALYPHMSVNQNITLGLRLRKVAKETIAERLSSVAETLGIPHLLDRMPRQLSGGQQQRVAVGRAIVRVPKVFLMDEPLSNLDSRLRLDTRTELVKLHRRLGVTAIYVTHDQGEAMTMATRIVVLKDGLVQQVGEPLEIYRHPANKFVASFVGSPEMNFLHGVVTQEGPHFFVSGPSFRVRLAPFQTTRLRTRQIESVWIGMRPESIRVESEPTQDCSVSAVVDVVEPLGRHTLVYCLVGDTPVVAEVSADAELQVGSKVFLTFEPTKMHAFETTGSENAVW
jgi:multiple sugar transport system ATP-binding protein